MKILVAVLMRISHCGPRHTHPRACNRDVTTVQFVVPTVRTALGLPHNRRHLEATRAEGLNRKIEMNEAESGQD